MFQDLFVEKYRPKNLDDIVLTADEKNYFLSLKEKQQIPNLLFAGSPGTGKTSLSKILINDVFDCQYLYINASDENGIDTIRTKVLGFSQTKSFDGKLKIVFLDECDSITFEAQKALRNVIEEFSDNTRFIFTCNYLFKIIPALQSRCQIFNLTPPLNGIIARIVSILKSENITVPEEEKPKLLEFIRAGAPDLRRIINDIQKFSFSGTLSIKNNNVKGLAEKVVTSKLSTTDVRKYVIEHEQDFSNDYLQLLKEMFECIFNNNELTQDIKTQQLLTISEYMYRDALVTDKEINWFSCYLKLRS